MATSWANVDNNFPTLDGGDIPAQLQAVVNYMYTLTEQLKYTLNNLDETNMNNAALDGFTGGINASVDKVNERADSALGKIRELTGESGKQKEKLSQLGSLLEDLTESVKELAQRTDELRQAVRTGEEGISIGGEGITVNITGRVFINGEEY